MLSINTNQNSIMIQNQLNRITDRLVNSTVRLSTGQKLNSTKDDAAGLYISSGLTPRISALTIGINAAQTGKNISDIAQGAITNMQNAFLRIRDLAVQASSDYYTTEARTAMQNEVNSLIDQIKMTKESCNFNGVNLLNANSGQLTIDDFDNVTTTTLRGTTIQTGDYQGTTYYLVNNADQLKVACGGQNGENFVLLSDIDLSGVTWGRCTNNATIDGNRHIINNLNSREPLICTNDGTIKNMGIKNSSVWRDDQGILCETNCGTISNCYITDSSSSSQWGALFCGVNGGVMSNCYVKDSNAGNSYGDNAIFCNSNDGTITNTFAFNITLDYNADYIWSSASIGTLINNYQNYKNDDPNVEYKTNEWFASSAAANTLGDAFEYVEGQSHPTLKWEQVQPSGSSALRIQTGFDGTTNSHLELNLGFDLGAMNFDISSANAAGNCIKIIDKYLSFLNDKQSIIGKDYNRLESAIKSNTIEIENMAAAKSVIVDADIAKEQSKYIKNQILQSAATTLLAQTNNINSQIVLGLLKSL